MYIYIFFFYPTCESNRVSPAFARAICGSVVARGFSGLRKSRAAFLFCPESKAAKIANWPVIFSIHSHVARARTGTRARPRRAAFVALALPARRDEPLGNEPSVLARGAGDTSRGKAPGNGLSKKLIYPNQSHAIGVGGTHEAPTPSPRRIEGYNCMLSYASAAGCWLTARAVVNMPNTRNGCAVP